MFRQVRPAARVGPCMCMCLAALWMGGYLVGFHQVHILTMKRCVMMGAGAGAGAGAEAVAETETQFTHPSNTNSILLHKHQPTPAQLDQHSALPLRMLLFSSGELSSPFSWTASSYTLTLPADQFAQPYVIMHVETHPHVTLRFMMATTQGTLSVLTSSCGSPSPWCGAPFERSSPGPFYDIWQSPQECPPHARTTIHQRWLPTVPHSLSDAFPFNVSFPSVLPHDFTATQQFMDYTQRWQNTHGIGSAAATEAPGSHRQYVLSVGPGVSTLMMTVSAPRSDSSSASPSPLTRTYTVTIVKQGALRRWLPLQPGIQLNAEQQVLIDSIPQQFASRTYGQTKTLMQGCHTSTNNHVTIHVHHGNIYVSPERAALGGLYDRTALVCNLLYTLMDVSPAMVPSRTMFLLDQNDVPELSISGRVDSKPQCAGLPILAFTTHKSTPHIIPIPDFSFWAHVDVYSNWNESRRQFYNMSWSVPTWSVRSPRLFFRGVRGGSKDRLRLIDAMNRAGHDFAQTSDKDYKSLKRQCRDYRYLIYFGGWDTRAWSTRLKYQLLCGSAVLADRVHTDYAYTEFWNKLLIPYTHYIPVTLDNILQQHSLLERSGSWSSVVGMSGRSLIWDVLTYEFVLEYLSAVLHELTRHVDVSTLGEPDPKLAADPDPDMRWSLYPRQSTPMTPVTNMRDVLKE